MLQDPNAIVTFMHWFRTASERAWAEVEERGLDHFRRQGVGGTSYRRGTRWLEGLTEEELARIEAREGGPLPLELRTFLAICGKTDRGLMHFGFDADDRIIQTSDEPIFYDWSNADEIAEVRKTLRDGILFHVETGSWLDEWGARPADLPQARGLAISKIEDGAKPYPLHGHRAVLPLEGRSLSPVLSSHGLDTIIYSTSLCRNLVDDIGLDLDTTAAPPVPDQASHAIYVEVRELPLWGALV